MKHRIHIFFAALVLLGACTQVDTSSEEVASTQSVSVNLAVNTRSVGDPMSVNGDQEFGSLAIYLFNDDDNFSLDKSALLSSFSSVSTKEIPIQTQSGAKLLYLIANYAGKVFKLSDGTSITLSTSTTKQELERLTTETTNGFSPNSLLMVSKQVLNIGSNDNGSTIAVTPLRRLQARVDVHVYKGSNYGSNTVMLESATLYNQALNSEVIFDYGTNNPQMLTPPLLGMQQVTTSTELLPYTAGTTPQPQQAQARFYSYQNLVTVFSPLQVTAPYLEIKLRVNGVQRSYKGYFVDAATSTAPHRYSLMQNNLYRVIAVLDTEAEMQFNLSVLPWERTDISYGRPITANDFIFAPWQNSWGGTNGKVMNTNVGGLEDAVFLFELKAPLGAAWTATLTNGLDFTFASSTAGTTTVPVSKGFTNPGVSNFIAVRATKRWTGEARDTELYVTVEGTEIPINPLIGSQRRYEGTDTRIKITQVASYN